MKVLLNLVNKELNVTGLSSKLFSERAAGRDLHRLSAFYFGNCCLTNRGFGVSLTEINQTELTWIHKQRDIRKWLLVQVPKNEHKKLLFILLAWCLSFPSDIKECVHSTHAWSLHVALVRHPFICYQTHKSLLLLCCPPSLFDKAISCIINACPLPSLSSFFIPVFVLLCAKCLHFLQMWLQ